jgi:hypothetical protein
MTDKLKLFTSPSAFPNPQRLRIWRRWQARPTFLAAYADKSSGVPELDDRS